MMPRLPCCRRADAATPCHVIAALLFATLSLFLLVFRCHAVYAVTLMPLLLRLLRY